MLTSVDKYFLDFVLDVEHICNSYDIYNTWQIEIVLIWKIPNAIFPSSGLFKHGSTYTKVVIAQYTQEALFLIQMYQHSDSKQST